MAERAAAAGVPVSYGARRDEARGRREASGGGKQRGRSAQQPAESSGGRTGGGEALVKEHDGVSLAELFADVDPAATGGLWLALDHIQDPHNVGAIFRTAAFFGVKGIVLTRDRSAPLNATVCDVASGGIEYVPFSVEANLARALETAKQRGLWTLGAAEEATTDIAEIPRDRPWLLVLGNEQHGLRRLTRDKCDMTCRIPSRGPVGSLNVSVAAGVLMASLG